VTVETGARSRNDRRSLLTATELPDPLAGPAGRPYMTEALDRPTRALQTAELAHTEGADDELVIAAAPPTSGAPNRCSTPTPALPHELAGGAFARDRLTSRIASVIEHHVPAMCYLAATDPPLPAQPHLDHHLGPAGRPHDC